MAEHRASDRGGWGVRMYGGILAHPSGSGLNCYSLGDVVAYDSEAEAEAEAERIRATGHYSRVTVEPVVTGQHAPSIAEEQHAIESSALVKATRRAALIDAAKLVRGLQGAHGLIFQEAAAICIEKLAE